MTEDTRLECLRIAAEQLKPFGSDSEKLVAYAATLERYVANGQPQPDDQSPTKMKAVA